MFTGRCFFLAVIASLVLGWPWCAMGSERPSEGPDAGRKTNCEHEASALRAAILQNTVGNNQGHPAGVPRKFAWYGGKTGTAGVKQVPDGFSAITGWAIVYQEASALPLGNPAGVRVFIKGFVTYVHLVTGSWLKVQDQANDPIKGAHFVADFSRDKGIPWDEGSGPDGSVAVDAPAIGYNDHFWPRDRGSYPFGQVDGAFVRVAIMTDTANANLIAAVGGDWWRDMTAPYITGFTNNPGIGQSNFTKLTTQWQTLYFSSLSVSDLLSNPPPLCATAD